MLSRSVRSRLAAVGLGGLWLVQLVDRGRRPSWRSGLEWPVLALLE